MDPVSIAAVKQAEVALAGCCRIAAGYADDGEGRMSFAGIIRDITARKKVEYELRESRARNQAIHDTAVDGIVTVTTPGPEGPG